MEWGIRTLDARQNKSRMIQLLTFDYIRLIDKPYVNGVTLREQNQPLKCCQPLDFWYTSLKGLDLSML